MNARLILITLVTLCAMFAVALVGLGQPSSADDAADDSPQTDRDRWMSVKLTSAQRILEDLTTGDFDGLEAHARRMQVMNLLEQWIRDEDVERKSDYQGQLNAFEFATKELIRHAADDNSEGALKAYVALTESCVRCHDLIRDGADE
ncbi:MAG: hypothetical protein KDA93_00045 [Planctomycetaceae bacterium]|nr:hypothetical protein [Planctomycetaceae bacterium]